MYRTNTKNVNNKLSVFKGQFILRKTLSLIDSTSTPLPVFVNGIIFICYYKIPNQM